MHEQNHYWGIRGRRKEGWMDGETKPRLHTQEFPRTGRAYKGQEDRNPSRKTHTGRKFAYGKAKL